jgi:hypothetical protein
MANLPYVTAPGTIERALKAIQAASTPERVSQDYVKTILKIPGGSGDQMTAFLRKIGFVSSDGLPTDVYKKFRNPSSTAEAAVAALKHGYAPLYKRNEFMDQLPDEKLRGLIIEETGHGGDSSVVPLILSSIKAIKKFTTPASFELAKKEEPTIPKLPEKMDTHPIPPLNNGSQKLGLNLSYTINLNLPATSDIAVFNAIFKSLKENLLRESNE